MGENAANSDIDPSCLINFEHKLVRIQYPGNVRNADKAIETLGGINNIERVVSNHRHLLDLNFHRNNRYNKPCFGDKDYNPGILVKVKMKVPKDKRHNQKPIFEYEVIGVTVQNIIFNRLVDFQYLPLAAKNQPETKESEVECIHNRIIPDFVPDLNFMNSEESKTMPLFFLPTIFARFDNPNGKLHLDPGEKYESEFRPEIAQTFIACMKKKSSKVTKTFNKKQQLSLTVNFTGGKVPEQASDHVKKLINERGLTEVYDKIKKLFEDRPVWTRSAICYISTLNTEQSKVVLPAVAYFVRRGPWRATWVRYGYDPRSNPEARIYQTLDYRIRAVDGTKQKISLKRLSVTKNLESLGPMIVQKFSLKDEPLQMKKQELNENCYILTPTTIPPARQMFYQYCDLLLPEIQKMLARLPQPPLGARCSSKYGWLPTGFTDQCREIVNKYILDTVQQEILKDNQQIIEKLMQEEKSSKEKPKQSEYCSRMLSNIRKGIYTQIPLPTSSQYKREDASDSSNTVMEYEIADGDDDDVIFETTAEEHIQRTIPERMAEDLRDDDNVEDDDEDEEEEQDREEESRDSADQDIDMEALDEVNQIVNLSVPKQDNISSQDELVEENEDGDSDEEINEMTQFLTKHL